MRREPGIAALDRGQSTLEGCHRISRTQSGQTATILLSPADYSRKHYVHLKKKKVKWREICRESWLTYQVVTLGLEGMRPTDVQTVFVEDL